jgi:hypothetical protein
LAAVAVQQLLAVHHLLAGLFPLLAALRVKQ